MRYMCLNLLSLKVKMWVSLLKKTPSVFAGGCRMFQWTWQTVGLFAAVWIESDRVAVSKATCKRPPACNAGIFSFSLLTVCKLMIAVVTHMHAKANPSWWVEHVCVLLCHELSFTSEAQSVESASRDFISAAFSGRSWWMNIKEAKHKNWRP